MKIIHLWGVGWGWLGLGWGVGGGGGVGVGGGGGGGGGGAYPWLLCSKTFLVGLCNGFLPATPDDLLPNKDPGTFCNTKNYWRSVIKDL